MITVPDSLIKKSILKQKDDNFDYYKRHILLENYDEEPEEPGVINSMIEKIKKEDGVVKAYTKWFDSKGNQSWKECEVLSYDENEKLFFIEIHVENEIKVYVNNKLENRIEISTIQKKVTRFNCLLKGESQDNLQRRVQLAENWKFYAQKYMAVYHVVDESKILHPYEFVDDSDINKLLSLCFLYKGKNKH